MEAVGSESRSMVQALEMLQKADRTDEDILGALDVLGDLLPGIDNAVDFAKAGGMRVVVQLLDELNAEVRTAAALALAGALRKYASHFFLRLVLTTAQQPGGADAHVRV